MLVARTSVAVLLGTLCACGPDVAPSAGDGSGASSESSAGEPEFDAEWFIGRWSTGRPDRELFSQSAGVTYLDAASDGTVTLTGLGDCGRSVSEPTELLWTPSGVDSVVLTELDGTPYGRDDESEHLVFVDECDVETGREFMDQVTLRDGEEVFRKERIYVRGSICLDELSPPDDPDVVQYVDCSTRWCDDGSPPEPLPCIGD
jgi:hypothetical protein